MAVTPVSARPLAVPIPVQPPARPWYAEVWIKLLRRKPLGTIGGVIVVVMLLGAVGADVLTPYGFAETNLRARFIPMNADHWLGTDQIGRDLLTRVLHGARISLYVGFGAVALGSLLATALGICSAYCGGRVDLLSQRAVDAWMAFPPLLILMSIMSLLNPGVLNITLVLGINFGIQNSRIVRGVALSIRENTYIESARAMGSGHARVTLVHMLPNVLPTIIVVATTGLSTVILTEASLSFLGLGVPPPHPTWGGMLSLAGLDHMYRAPWLAIWPAVALSLAVFGFNMLGDALRDLLDPRLKGG
ncbi:MAG TPA: ABC transporter permease [Methylomirabilota bacterium]|jgi:peptide/nickel transport system permease protein|nr:ABC transporter permease [Methylomirabilota bacterium]